MTLAHVGTRAAGDIVLLEARWWWGNHTSLELTGSLTLGANHCCQLMHQISHQSNGVVDENTLTMPALSKPCCAAQVCTA